ncbi:MAG: DUF6261 family protein [Chitinophagaceae bacterium]|jgi:hypothetical protein
MEFIQFISDLLAITEEAGPAKLHLQKEHSELTFIVDEMNLSFKYWQAMPETKGLQEADKRRIAAYTGIRMNVKSFLFHHDSEMRNAATLLYKNINKYGTRLSLRNYPTKTTNIEAILQDWATKPVLSKAMANLQLAAWHAEMQTANELFKALHIDRVQKIAAKGAVTTKQKREEAVVIYNHMRQLTTAYYTINKSEEELESFVNSWNALISQYKVLITGKIGI